MNFNWYKRGKNQIPADQSEGQLVFSTRKIFLDVLGNHLYNYKRGKDFEWFFALVDYRGD